MFHGISILYYNLESILGQMHLISYCMINSMRVICVLICSCYVFDLMDWTVQLGCTRYFHYWSQRMSTFEFML